jgi:hypothetical protein
MTTVQRNYELSEETKDLIDQAYTALDKEVCAMRKRFATETAAWQRSDAGGFAGDWLADMAQLRDAVMIAEWNTNPLTDGCTSFDENGDPIDDDD